MASSSGSSFGNSSVPKSSRFSTTFKGFKLTRDKASKPPPPPPKDPYYLRNRSLASLSPDSLSIPPYSPLSPFLHRPPPNMNQSTMSLVSSATSSSFSPSDAPHPPARPRHKMSTFFRLRRSPKSPLTKNSPSAETLPPPPTEDENISLPWNFQHNIHVDEGFAGMPPSWSTSLAQAGFTSAEIADIQSRRTAGTRSPGSTYFFQDRPASPADSATATAIAGPVLTHPTPRSTSLFRKYSDASLISTAHSTRQTPPPLPASGLGSSPSLRSLHSNQAPSNGITKTLPHRQTSVEQGASHHPSTSSFSIPRSSDSQSHSNGSVAFTQDDTSSVASPPRTELSRPSTPPRRTYHVANDAIGSPPPSYTQFSSSTAGRGVDKKGGPTQHSSPAPSLGPTTRSHTPSTSCDSARSGSHNTPESGSCSASKSTRTGTSNPAHRLTALPPRLSLHKNNDSTDLSKWGEALWSGISTASADSTQNSSTSATAQDVAERSTMSVRSEPSSSTSQVSTARPSPPRHQQQRSRENVPPRLPPPTRPIPPVVVNGKLVDWGHSAPDSERGDVPPPSSVWAEPASSARSEPSADWPGNELEHTTPASALTSQFSNTLVQADATREQRTYAAALSESRSPVLPSTLWDDRRDVIGGEPAGSDLVDERMAVGMLSADGTWARDTNRDSSRSSTSTVTVTGFMEPPTIVRNVSVARRTGAYVTKLGAGHGRERDQGNKAPNGAYVASVSIAPSNEVKHPPSPLSSTFGSEEGSASGSGSSSSISHDHPTPTTEDGTDSPLLYYMDTSPSPDPSKVAFSPSAHHHLLVSATDTFGGVRKDDEDADMYEEEGNEENDENEEELGDAPADASIARPKIIISGAPGSGGIPTPLHTGTTTASPLSPFQRYRGWLSEVAAPLEEFIDETVDPRDYYLDLQEIAEGESGSIYAARLTDINIHKLKLPPLIKARDGDDLANGRTTLVAIKSVAIMPSGSPKLVDLKRELTLMKGLWHDNVLSMDALYVDLVEDALWIRMELMERSLADLIGLIGSGLMLQERMMARFANDVLQALQHLEQHCIAHRDVRSDNLLVNSHGILKLTDFSNAVQVTRESPSCSDIAGVLYWQAPEMRCPPYNALKVDVWSLGATVWEMAETEPPFADTQQVDDRWPPLSQSAIYSPAFRDFLRQCSEPPATRPTPSELRKSSFINNACGRPVIVQLLSQCMAIEQALRRGEVSHGPDSE